MDGYLGASPCETRFFTEEKWVDTSVFKMLLVFVAWLFLSFLTLGLVVVWITVLVIGGVRVSKPLNRLFVVSFSEDSWISLGVLPNCIDMVFLMFSVLRTG